MAETLDSNALADQVAALIHRANLLRDAAVQLLAEAEDIKLRLLQLRSGDIALPSISEGRV